MLSDLDRIRFELQFTRCTKIKLMQNTLDLFDQNSVAPNCWKMFNHLGKICRMHITLQPTLIQLRTEI